MAYFPAFLKLDNRSVLLVGGGKIATEKLEKLIDFTHRITIVAPDVSERIEQIAHDLAIPIHRRPFVMDDLEGSFLVVVAVDDLVLQRTIYEACQDRHILCNSVDSVDYCDFIFPSYTKRGDLTIAFSTSGVSPSLAKYLRRAIEKMIPDSIEDFLNELKTLRASLPKGKARMQRLDRKAKTYIQKHFEGEDDVL